MQPCMALSENMVPLNPLVNHTFPYMNTIWGYTVYDMYTQFSDTHIELLLGGSRFSDSLV